MHFVHCTLAARPFFVFFTTFAFIFSSAHTFSCFLSNLSTFTSRNFRILHSCIVGLKLDSLCFSLDLYFDVFESFHSLLSGSFSLLSSFCCIFLLEQRPLQPFFIPTIFHFVQILNIFLYYRIPYEKFVSLTK
jgi:hypothetical protein